ncbi:MAG: MarR family transcriptional regulator [Alkalispirochaeta sp.]
MNFELDAALGYLIETTEQALKRGLRRRFREHGYDITPYQWVVLYRLWDRDGQSQSELADGSLRDRPTVTRILDVMERKGLVTRHKDDRDRRSYRVYLTDYGESLKNRLPSVAADYLDAFTEGIDPADIQVAKNVLRKIRENASQEIEQGTPIRSP